MQALDLGSLISAPNEGKRVQIGGLGVIFKVYSKRAQGAVAVVEHTLASGFLGAPPHLHQREDEISFGLSGELTAQVGDQVFTLGPGSLLFKPRRVMHAFWNNGAQEARFLEIIAPGGFESYFLELAQLVSPDSPPDPGAMAALRQKYGLEYAMDRVPELMQRYNLRLT